MFAGSFGAVIHGMLWGVGGLTRVEYALFGRSWGQSIASWGKYAPVLVRLSPGFVRWNESV